MPTLRLKAPLCACSSRVDCIDGAWHKIAWCAPMTIEIFLVLQNAAQVATTCLILGLT
jgi:hypothetical protein